MAIASTDITIRLSGGAANAAVDTSLGGAKSATLLGTSAAQFDAVSGAEAASGDVEYRCFYLHNAHGSLTLQGSSITVQADTPEASTTIEVGVGTSAVNGTEQTVANENTAPAGVAFGASATLGDIPAGQARAFWVRRTVAAGAAAVTGTTYTLRPAGNTAA